MSLCLKILAVIIFALISQKLKLIPYGKGRVLNRKKIIFSNISSRGNINNCLLSENDHEHEISANQPIPEKR